MQQGDNRAQHPHTMGIGCLGAGTILDELRGSLFRVD